MANHGSNHAPNLIAARGDLVHSPANKGGTGLEAAWASITAPFDSLAYVCDKLGNLGGTA